ncbi:hypothetical protein SAMN04488500_102206 [Sporomusa malonica]|uniref:Uncharacterized protein n=1 Tax=Sporomusa malonica TaxID=112901 RepID=A0A1W1YV69_9FIRM|nr:hypothetical protein SAMN04488500_102206 [Sporomusa malonica]
MKENMYTYHYFQNRAVQRPSRTANYVFHVVLLSSTAYIATTLVYLIK